METDPDFVVLDEPTKGIDVGARANIYEIIHAVAARGKGVLVVSSEAEELLSLCHRILVMRNGQIVGRVRPRPRRHRRPHPHRPHPPRLTTICHPALSSEGASHVHQHHGTAPAVHHYEEDTSRGPASSAG